MTKFSVEINGYKETHKKLREQAEGVKTVLEKAVVGTAIEARRSVVQGIQNGPASGVVYQKYSPRRTHQASAPGEAPMSDTGRLANSVFYQRVSDLKVVIGTALIYAAWLEYGTRARAQGSGMNRGIRPRPIWTPVAKEAERLLIKRVKRAIKKMTQ